MIKSTYNLQTFEATTAAEIATKVFAKNNLVVALDTGVIKKRDGITAFSALPAFGTIATKAAAQPDSVATTAAGIVTDFNLLLAKLRAAGMMTP